MHVLSKRGKLLIAVLCILGIVLMCLAIAMIKNMKLEKLNDAIRLGNNEEIMRQVDRLSVKEIDSAESKKRIYHPLNLACEKGNFDAVKMLVEKGVNINPKEYNTGNTPLLSALYNRNSLDRCRIASYLIENGADVDSVNKYGETALTRVIYNSQNTREESMELFKFLYDNSNIESMFPNSYMKADNALEMVSAYDMPELVDWLIKTHSFSYSDIPNSNRSYLHYFYMIDKEGNLRKKRNMIGYIVKNNLEDINNTDEKGRTILSIAAEFNEIEDCQLFMQLGANPSIADVEGKTALDYASEKNNEEIVKMLENAG